MFNLFTSASFSYLLLSYRLQRYTAVPLGNSLSLIAAHCSKKKFATAKNLIEGSEITNGGGNYY